MIGLLPGRFLPPTVGAVRLAQQAAAQVDRLVVLVVALPEDPIPADLRVAWMRALCNGAVVLPAEGELTAVARRAGPVDAVFGDAALAGALGARHVPSPPAEEPPPGAILTCPAAHWADLPAQVRPWFVRRVVLLGAESTGKTTMAERLAARYGAAWVPELARGWLALRGNAFGPDDLIAIAEAQTAAEAEATLRADRVVFCDTDALVTAVYGERYFGAAPPRVLALSQSRADLRLLFHPDVPWVPDAIRDLPDERAALHARFERALAERSLPWADVRGGWEERLETCISAVDALLAGPARPLAPDGRLFDWHPGRADQGFGEV